MKDFRLRPGKAEIDDGGASGTRKCYAGERFAGASGEALDCGVSHKGIGLEGEAGGGKRFQVAFHAPNMTQAMKYVKDFYGREAEGSAVPAAGAMLFSALAADGVS